MICTECKATIADKAIVCYRCGAPTAIPAFTRPEREAGPASRRRSPLSAIVTVLAAAGLGWFSIESDPQTTEGAASAVAAVVTLIGGGYLALRRRK